MINHKEKSERKKVSDSKHLIMKKGQFGERLREMSDKMSIRGKLVDKKKKGVQP